MSQINLKLLLQVLFTCCMILYTVVSEKTELSGEASNDVKKELFVNEWDETASNNGSKDIHFTECKNDDDCSNGKICNEKELCACEEGMGGQNCKDILGCKELNATCAAEDAVCIFDDDQPTKATCKCNKFNFVYNTETKKCEECLCGKNEECEFEDGEKICTCIDGYSVNNDSECQACNCGEGSQGCSFKDGVKSCYCRFKYVEKDGVCEACNCGEESWGCSLKDGDKICRCHNKYADKNGTCVACDCGEGSKGCSFKDGVKKCDCRSQYGDKDGVCEACHCGEKSIGCFFKGGEMICVCPINYELKDGICAACNCGNASFGCSFKDGVKFCECLPLSAVNEDVCETCNCGSAGVGCSFKDGVKFCNCLPSSGNNEGVCEKCNCGFFNLGCSFKNGSKTCNCYKGYAQKNDWCESCNCGNGTCFFKDNRQSCICDPGFVEDYGYCKELPCEKECKNGGNCKKVNGASFCDCIRGTSGDFCENIDECPEKNTFCEARQGTECFFDVKQRKAACKCIDGDLKFDEKIMRCRSACTSTGKGKKCKNYGSCELSGRTDKFCVCKKGTSGDYCETIAKCSDLDCGDKATCEYDKVAEDAYCKCKDGKTAFDLVDKCSVNYCKEKCKVEKGSSNEIVECTGNVYKQEELKCKCREDHKEFNIEKAICEDYCTVKCGTNNGVTCEGDKTNKDKIECKCSGKNEDFIDSERVCKAKAIAANNKTGAIVGGVVGTLLVIGLIVAAFILYRKLSKTNNDYYTSNRQMSALSEKKIQL